MEFDESKRFVEIHLDSVSIICYITPVMQS